MTTNHYVFETSPGTLIFGGIDKKKYSGSLVKIPFETLSFQVDGQTVPDTR